MRRVLLVTTREYSRMIGLPAFWIISLLIPSIIAEGGDESLLERLRVINPFDPSIVAQLNLTAREDGVSIEAQAFNIVDGDLPS